MEEVTKLLESLTHGDFNKSLEELQKSIGGEFDFDISDLPDLTTEEV
jgi:hypothetical protein